MKALLISLFACAGLAGCAGYGDPYYGGYSGYGYGYGYYGPTANIGVYHGHPAYGAGVYSNVPRYTIQGRPYRDRDGDGVPNNVDSDRDNDGVPNRHDARPNNPRRR